MENYLVDDDVLEYAFEHAGDGFPNPDLFIKILLGIAIAYIGVFLITIAISVVFWALQAVGVYKMSEKDNFKNPWYSFIPFFDAIAIGRLGFGYNKKNMAVTKDNSKALLVLRIIFSVISIVLIFSLISFVARTAIYSELGGSDNYKFSLVTSAGLFILVYLAFLGIAIAYKVTYYICLYNIYLKFNRDNAVLFTVLGIFFSFLIPIFLFISRKNEPCYSEEEFRRKKLAKLNAMVAAQKAAQAAQVSQAVQTAQPEQEAAPAAPAEEVKEETSSEEIKEEKPEE